MANSAAEYTTKNTTRVGAAAEARVAEYLGEHGYAVLARNERNRFSEIDIVATCPGSDGRAGEIVFVEVKFRRNADFGGGAEAITADKQMRLRRAAEFWLARHPRYRNLQPRIDIIVVEGTSSPFRLHHYENALES